MTTSHLQVVRIEKKEHVIVSMGMALGQTERTSTKRELRMHEGRYPDHLISQLILTDKKRSTVGMRKRPAVPTADGSIKDE